MTTRDDIEAIFRRVQEGDGEVYAEDINDTMSLLGFFNDEIRFRMYTKVSNTLDNIAEARAAVRGFKEDPRVAFYRYVGEGRYAGASTADHYHEYFTKRGENDMKFLCGLVAHGEKPGK